MMPINLEISAYYNKSILSSAVSRTDSELENKVILIMTNLYVRIGHLSFLLRSRKPVRGSVKISTLSPTSPAWLSTALLSTYGR